MAAAPQLTYCLTDGLDLVQSGIEGTGKCDMTDGKPPFDTNAALDASTELITEARAVLIQTINDYQSTGPNLTKYALEHIERLNLPVSPARTEAATGLRSELRNFGDFWVTISWHAGALLFALVNRLTALAMQMMSLQSPSTADLEDLDPIARALAFGDAIHQSVERNKIIVASAVVAESDVAKAVLEVAGLLAARLDVLDAFIRRVSQATAVPNATPRSARIFSKIAIKEGLLLTASEILNAAIRELPKHVPVVGIAASVVNIGLDVRSKKRELHERREHLENIAKAYISGGATDDMSIQLWHFQEDNKTVKELVTFIDKLIQQLSVRPT